MQRSFRRNNQSPRDNKPKSKAKHQEKAVDLKPIRLLVTLVCFILALAFLLTTNAKASSQDLNDFKSLEKTVWLNDSKDFNRIEKQLVRWIQTNPYSVQAHYLLAHLYIRKYAESPSELELLKKSSELAQQAIDLNPHSDLGYIAIAEVLDIMGQTQNALKVLDSTLNPDVNYSWRRWLLYSKFRSDRLSNDELLKSLDRAMSSKDAQWEIISPYAIAILNSLYQDQNLIATLDAWDKKYPNYLFKESQALAYARLGQFAKAHSLFVQTYSPHMDRIEPLINDAILLYKHLGQSDKAKMILEHIVTRLPTQCTNSLLSIALTHLGTIYLAETNTPKAAHHFRQALEQSDDKFQVLEMIANQYRSTHKYKELAEFISQSNESMPGSGILYALLGETLSEDIGEHDQALEAFNNAIILEPHRSDYYNGMGLAYYRKQSFNKALAIFTQASKINPDDAVSRYNVACVLSKLNRPTEAILSLKEAISLDPRLVENAKNDSDFRNLRAEHQFVELVDKAHSNINNSMSQVLAH